MRIGKLTRFAALPSVALAIGDTVVAAARQWLGIVFGISDIRRRCRVRVVAAATGECQKDNKGEWPKLHQSALNRRHGRALNEPEAHILTCAIKSSYVQCRL